MQYLKFTGMSLLLISLASGCTKVPPADDLRVSSIVKDRIGNTVHWNELHKDNLVTDAVSFLVKQELTVDSAVEIALLNNPKIQATFEELGIAQADLVQAGLFQNPIFDGFIRFSNQRSVHVNTEFSVVQNFLDIFLIPLRKRVAAAEFEQAELRVASVILDLSFEVRETYYSLVTEQKKLQLTRTLIDASDAASLLAKEQRRLGNINDLELQSRMNDYLETTLELSRTEIEIVRLREKMNTLLGFSADTSHLKITTELPSPPSDVDLKTLETIALSKRLDLEIARWELERIARLGATKRWWSYTDASIGISNENDPEGNHVTGPTFNTKIPIFNYGQADRARLLALYRKSKEQLKALEIQVTSDVRQAQKQLQLSRNLVATYQEKLLPLQAQIVSMSQKFYNVMGVSVFKLLQAKKQEIQTQINHTQTLCSYWVTSVKLDRALGGKLYLATSAVQATPSTQALCQKSEVLP